MCIDKIAEGYTNISFVLSIKSSKLARLKAREVLVCRHGHDACKYIIICAARVTISQYFATNTGHSKT